MAEQNTIEIEDDTLDSATEQIQKYIPQGFQLVSKFILSDGNPKVVTGSGMSTEEALADARSKVPSDGVILDEKELHSALKSNIIVEALDELNAKLVAREAAKNEFGDRLPVVNLDLVSEGAKGFLGIGAKPNRYNVVLAREAKVEVTFRTRPKIRITIGKESQETRLNNIKNQIEINNPDALSFFVISESKNIYEWLRLNEGKNTHITIKFSDVVRELPGNKIEGIWQIKKPQITVNYHPTSLTIFWDIDWDNHKFKFSNIHTNSSWYNAPSGLSISLGSCKYSVKSTKQELTLIETIKKDVQEDVQEGYYAIKIGEEKVNILYSFVIID